MTEAINNQIESLISLQKMQAEYSNSTSNFVSSENLSEKGSNAELRAVADQFEAIFLEMLLKQARDSKLSDGLFDTKADDNFVQLFDRELAKSSSEKVDIGIAEAIVSDVGIWARKMSDIYGIAKSGFAGLQGKDLLLQDKTLLMLVMKLMLAETPQ